MNIFHLEKICILYGRVFIMRSLITFSEMFAREQLQSMK